MFIQRILPLLLLPILICAAEPSEHIHSQYVHGTYTFNGSVETTVNNMTIRHNFSGSTSPESLTVLDRDME